MSKEIEEGNKLIAEFMGLHFHKTGWVDARHIDGNYECPELKYHYSWDWLMPVVEKIESLEDGRFITTIETGYCVISDNGENAIVEMQSDETKIENTRLAVIKFIEWLNEQTI